MENRKIIGVLVVETDAILGDLRRSYGLLGKDRTGAAFGMSSKRAKDLYWSLLPDETVLRPFAAASSEQFDALLAPYKKKKTKSAELSHEQALRKNDRLAEELERKRGDFAGIGTNRTKRRLNKLALVSPVARAVRLALEIEDKSICAKKCRYGTYKDKMYEQKERMIMTLCRIFKEQGWRYGAEPSSNRSASHVAYFEIPGCEQVSWHLTLSRNGIIPPYMGEWDGKRDSTLRKLEAIAGTLLQQAVRT